MAESTLFIAFEALSPSLPLLWGTLAIIVILIGVYVLVFDKPPIGKANCFVAWMLWLFAAIVYVMTSAWLVLFTVAIPGLIFWTWQYFSLAKFRQQDVVDSDSMLAYDDGKYDSRFGGKRRRLDNRGVDEDDRTPD